jgi:hypothetical protein
VEAERDDAFAKGIAHGQAALRQITGPLQVVDSPELAALRAENAKLREALTAAVEYMEFHSTAQCEPYPLDKCRAALQVKP